MVIILLITTSAQPCGHLAPLEGQVDGLDLAARRAGEPHQALGCEVGQAVAQVALVVGQGPYKVPVIRRYGALDPLKPRQNYLDTSAELSRLALDIPARRATMAS